MIKVIIIDDKFNLQVMPDIDQKRKVNGCYFGDLDNSIGREDCKDL
ncbi:MAG: hypothetical protein ACI9FO_001365 [Methylophagaceae bacterium]|jgi:hypothetical protein